jgi:hypothetical protein
MDSSIESSDNPSRINDLEVQKNTDGTVDVVVYWNKINVLDRKDTSNRRWLRRQLKRIVDNIEIDVKVGQLDLFTDTTTITFKNAEDASVAVLSLN